MKLFDWLKPSRTPVELTRDYVNLNTSALAQMPEGGSAVILDQGQTLVKLAEAKYLEAKRIAESLREFPDDWAWRHKGYELEHVPTGFCMWVANKDYGLAEITSHGGKHEFNKAEQKTIWPSVEAWLARGKVGFTGRLPKVRIHRANGVWWCLAKEHPWAGAGVSPVDAYRSWARAVSIQERKDKTPHEPLQVWSRAL